jgi:predicted ATPase
MRSIRAQDYWRRANSRKFVNFVEEIDLHGHNGINNIILKQGIYAICGLNGAGKSTIISAVKDLIGLQKTKQDYTKVGVSNISGKIKYKNIYIECTNLEGNRLKDKGEYCENISFIDYDQANRLLDFFWGQDNVDELIEQNESINFEQEEVEIISYIVGREYTKIRISEFEDIEGLGTIPYFSVDTMGIQYDTRNMGIGEHFLFYIFWKLWKAPVDSMVIIEEPETFIGLESQRNLMNYIAKVVTEKGISTVLTTHSPYILENIKNENISIIGRVSGMVGITNPSIQVSANAILGEKNRVCGTFFVEDEAAEMFLEIILEDINISLYRNYTIQAVGSSSEITKCLQCIKTIKVKYNFVGIYDEDQREQLEGVRLNWPHTYLPVKDDVETTMKKLLSNSDNIRLFSEELNINIGELIIILSSISGEDHHDWFHDLCRKISKNETIVLRALYKIWKNDNTEAIEAFNQELGEICI